VLCFVDRFDSVIQYESIWYNHVPLKTVEALSLASEGRPMSPLRSPEHPASPDPRRNSLASNRPSKTCRAGGSPRKPVSRTLPLPSSSKVAWYYGMRTYVDNVTEAESSQVFSSVPFRQLELKHIGQAQLWRKSQILHAATSCLWSGSSVLEANWIQRCVSPNDPLVRLRTFDFRVPNVELDCSQLLVLISQGSRFLKYPSDWWSLAILQN
jgi:hypothetical protein